MASVAVLGIATGCATAARDTVVSGVNGAGCTGSHVWGDWYSMSWADGEASTALAAAQELELAGHVERAIAMLSEANDALPAETVILEARGALYTSMGFHRAAARDFELVTEAAPDNARAWVALGDLRRELGLLRGALAALDRACAEGARGPKLDLSYARTLRDLDRRLEAAIRYAQALRGMERPGLEVLVEAARLAEEAPPSPHAIAAARGQLGWDTERGEAGRAAMAELAYATPAELAERWVDCGDPASSLSSWVRIALLAIRLDARLERDPAGGGEGSLAAAGRASSDG